MRLGKSHKVGLLLFGNSEVESVFLGKEVLLKENQSMKTKSPEVKKS